MDPDLIDPNLVFAKTASGEEAVLQRTRVVQRNTRMVLILVDGNATVAELCDKTGNPQMTRSALLELERDGLVDRRAAYDSVWQRGEKARQRAASDETTAPVSEFSSFGTKEQTAPPPLPASQASASFDVPPAREASPPPTCSAHVTPPPSRGTSSTACWSERADRAAPHASRPSRRTEPNASRAPQACSRPRHSHIRHPVPPKPTRGGPDGTRRAVNRLRCDFSSTAAS